MIGLIDTNLYKRLTKNTAGIHEKFLETNGVTRGVTKWAVSPFGWLEYLGLAFRKNPNIPPIPIGWTAPRSVIRENKVEVDMFGVDLLAHCYWIKTHAKKYYLERLTKDLLESKAAEEKKFHSDEFIRGPLINPLFRRPLYEHSADSLAELLMIDYLHRLHIFPKNLAALSQESSRLSMLAEYYDGQRNVILARGFKQIWFGRTKGPHENHIEKNTMLRLEQAMGRLKTDADRFDHDLLGYFLLGYSLGGGYGPVTIFTQDNPEEVFARLAAFHSIMIYTWKEWKDFRGVKPMPFFPSSRYIFVTDRGEGDQQITINNVRRFLLDEKILS